MGRYRVKHQTEPQTPPSEHTDIYVNSTNKRLTTKDDDGTVTEYANLEDEAKVKVSSDDSTPSYLENKIIAGNGVNISVSSPSENEKLLIELDSFDYIQLSPITPPTYAEGILFYDNNEKTITIYNDQNGVSQQIGRELWSRSCNNNGSTITNGKVVYISGIDTGCPEVSLANAKYYEKSRIIGVTTQDILTSNQGEVTAFGLVRGINTSALSLGRVYLSETDGGLTNTKPTGGSFIVTVGVVLVSDSTNGIIYVNPSISDTAVEITEVNGFPSSQRTATTLAFTDLTRTFTIAPTSSEFYFYQNGIKYEKSSSETLVIPDEEGLYLIYYNAGSLAYVKNPTTSQIETALLNYTVVSYVYWDYDNQLHNLLLDERHGINMSNSSHSYLHFIFGTQYLSGLSLTSINPDASGSLNTSTQFGVESGLIADEDLITSTSTILSTTGIPVYYLNGINADQRRSFNSGFPILTSGTGRLAYNEKASGVTWQLTEVTNNYFALYHIFATNSSESDNLIISVPGIDQYSSIVEARNAATTEILSIMQNVILPEMSPIATIILETSDSFTNAVKSRIVSTSDGGDYQDWRNSQISKGITPLPHDSLTNLKIAGSSVYYGHITNESQTINGQKTFIDDLFLADDSDNTKKVKFDISPIDTSTTRTISMPNFDLKLPEDDGTLGQLVCTDGSGQLGFCDPTSASGNNTEIQYNSGGDFAASSSLTWNDTDKELSVTGEITIKKTGQSTSEFGIYLDATKLAGFFTNNLGTSVSLYINGVNYNFSQSRLNTPVPIQFPNGTIAAPSITFVGMQDGGISRNSTSDYLSMSINAIEKQRWTDDGVLIGDIVNNEYLQVNNDGVATFRQSYGEMYENNASGTSITLTTSGTYYGWVSATSGELKGTNYVTFSDNATADRLVIGTNGAGIYDIDVTFSFTGSNSQTITGSIFKNDSEITKLSARRGLGTSPPIGNANISGKLSLAANDYIDLRFSSSESSASITIYNINVSLTRISI